MTSISPRAPWDCRICRCIAAAALVLAAINPSFFSGHVVVTGMVFGAQSGDDAPTRTPPPARTPISKQAPTKLSPSQVPPSRLKVRSKIALVVDANTSEELLVKNADKVVPIASITKLMTAMVVIDAKLPPREMLRINNDDRDLLMGTSSRLQIGWALSREDMLHLALMSSENRAAAALSRYYPGGRPAFIRAMNAKAAVLGMTNTHFVNPNGLTNENVSTAIDLAELVRVADHYPLIRQFTTDPHYDVRIGRYILSFVNTNRLVGRPDWDIEVQKTGFTNEAGDCVVMRVNAEGRALIMIFLDANGKLTRFADARRVLMQLALAQKR
ncbi:MAG: D-alanyl-D-alanine endopeptidase [Terriglobia bacterium]|jgi:D-alanyl-D-alanine endopeptidase (penicillin-binding protein 7)